MTSNAEELVKCVELPGRGRGLVTTKALDGGQVILRESPTLVYVAASCALRYCGTCLRSCPPPPTAALSCATCRAATFCSSACSRLHSPLLCSALARLEASGFKGGDDDGADQARFLLAAYHLALSSRPELERLMLLEGSGPVDDSVRRLHSFVEDAVRDWPWSSSSADGVRESVLSVDLTANLLAKDARNTFGHMAPAVKGGGDRSVRGFGVYQTASFINHDCLPNACRFDYVDAPGDSNSDIYIRALHPIPENTEVTISYFPINWSFKDRTERLLEEYGFQCACKRCQVEVGWSVNESENEDEDEDEKSSSESAEPDENHGNGKATSRNVEEREANGEDEGEIADDDFRHAIYFVKFLCPIDDCGGTMAPLAPTAALACTADWTMECNMCGHLRTDDELYRAAAHAWEAEKADK